MKTSDTRVTARIVKTGDGETYREYRAGGVAFGLIEAVHAALNAR